MDKYKNKIEQLKKTSPSIANWINASIKSSKKNFPFPSYVIYNEKNVPVDIVRNREREKTDEEVRNYVDKNYGNGHSFSKHDTYQEAFKQYREQRGEEGGSVPGNFYDELKKLRKQGI